MSVCGHDCGCNTPCDKPVTLEELLDAAEEEGHLMEREWEFSREDAEVPVADLIQRVKERRMGL